MTAQAAVPATDINYGEIFTRRWVVELILDLVGYTAERDLSSMVVLEPACGSGAFLVPMAERLSASLKAHGKDLSSAATAIRAHDLLPRNVEAARQAVAVALTTHGWSPTEASRLAKGWITVADFLLHEQDVDSADFVVGNPPYIRLEEIDSARSKAYRQACPTMGGRADIFVGFFEVGLRALRTNGRLGYICADRWMRNAYGKQLRELVSTSYAVDATLVMHDVEAFEEHVSAYPAITILRAGTQGTAIIADTTRDFGPDSAANLVKWVATDEQSPLECPGLRAAVLPHWFKTSSGWPTGSPDRLALVARLEDRFPSLEETGAKVGIGLASGADHVFVSTNRDTAEPQRLLPMVMRSDIRSGEIDWSGHFLVNPWSPEGLVELQEWPRLAAYFRKHWATLASRHVGRKNPGREHRTIDRVIEGLATRSKLLLPDMNERIWPVLDSGEYYPHHNLYWIHEGESDWDLRVLGGLLLSDVAELFVSTYCVRMRGGTLRFQAQYLRRIRVPRFADINPTQRETLAAAFDARNVGAATAVALEVYGLEAIPT